MDKQEFLNIIRRETLLMERDAERITIAVLHALRSQLSTHEISDIYESLPEDIDGLWEGSWLQRVMSRLQSIREMTKDEFIEQVREATDVRTPAEAENLARAVFSALKAAIPAREVEHILRDLPNDLREMWQLA